MDCVRHAGDADTTNAQDGLASRRRHERHAAMTERLVSDDPPVQCRRRRRAGAALRRRRGNHQVTQEAVRGREAIRSMFAREFATARMVCIPAAIHDAGESSPSNGGTPWACAAADSSRSATLDRLPARLLGQTVVSEAPPPAIRVKLWGRWRAGLSSRRWMHERRTSTRMKTSSRRRPSASASLVARAWCGRSSRPYCPRSARPCRTHATRSDFAGFTHHVGFYPTPSGIETCRKELSRIVEFK
jgi:hypothetical protein